MNVYSDAWAWYWDTAGTVWVFVLGLIAQYPLVAGTLAGIVLLGVVFTARAAGRPSGSS